MVRALVRIRFGLYRWGVLRAKKLPLRVVCVGNLTLGGTGKTPTVEYISRMMRDAGLRVAVLSRGYRGAQEKELGIVSDGRGILLSPKDAGDEPYLLARRLEEVPVLVGRDRYESGKLAFERFQSQVAILDDGYQHIQLQREIDILLVDGRVDLGGEHVFPLGSLREPLRGLTRASQFVITKSEREDKVRSIEATLKHWNPEAAVFHGRYAPESLLDPQTGNHSRADALEGRKILALAGLADPAYFFELLGSLGARIVKEIVFPDHQRYSQKDLEFIRRQMPPAEWVVTTEKDWVRLEQLDLDGLPIRVLTIRMAISEKKAFDQGLLSRLKVELTHQKSRKDRMHGRTHHV